MSPLPPSGDVIVTNDGVITPYVREQVTENIYRVDASLNADVHVTYIDIYGFEDENVGNFDFPPSSNVQEINRLENGVIRVIGSEPWMPAPFELKFEFATASEIVYNFYVTFE